jgi:C-terminal processing protease CtpA/Prc
LDKRLANVPRFDTMIAKMFDDIRAKNIKTLVIDVRNNGGGNSVLCEILLSYLKNFQEIKLEKSYTRFSPLFAKFYPSIASDALKALKERNIPFVQGNIYQSQDLDLVEGNKEYKALIDKYFIYNSDEKNIFRGNVIFIQGKNTYSSAGLLITAAVDNKIGQIIGEKSIYKPCNYGDVLSWQLPNTQVSGGISHKIFNRPDETKCSETCIIPNVLLEETLENMLQGEDIYWNYILNNYTK